MTLDEAILIAKAYDRETFPISEAKKLWAPIQKKNDLTEKQICRKTFARIKMVESLLKKGLIHLDPSRLHLYLHARPENGSNKYNIWFEIIDMNRKAIEFSCLYENCLDGNCYVFDSQNNVILKGESWKKLQRVG